MASKNVRRRKNVRKTRKRYRRPRGGQAIAAGGFGCVFHPALVCKDKETSKEERERHVSKLMIEPYAKKEYAKIKSIESKLKKIPHYENYFLVYDIDLCQPAPLTEKDLTSFDKCNEMMPSGVDRDNINKQLDRFLSLSLPNGGFPPFDYLQTHRQHMYLVHQKLVDLLRHGILPMNRRDIFHVDIKESNILVQTEGENNMKARLIDWGLASIYRPQSHKVLTDPEPWTNTVYPWTNRGFMFNVPFTNNLFNQAFYDRYTAYLEKGGQLNESSLIPFLTTYFDDLDEGALGHLNYIEKVMKMLYKDELSNGGVKSMIVDYWFHVLVHFTRETSSGLKLYATQYINDVYVKSVDLYGFVCVYIPLAKIVFEEMKTKMTREKKALFTKLRELFFTYLYAPRVGAIDQSELIEDLESLGDLIRVVFPER